MFTNIKAAIFDLDGTLVESMSVWENIDVGFLIKRGIPAPADLFEHSAPLNAVAKASYFKENYKIDESIDDIVNEFIEMGYREYSTNVKLKDGAKEYLDYLKSKGIKLSIATGNTPRLVEAALKSNGIYDYFDLVITSDEVSNGKDKPDIYLLSAKKLKVRPDECIVFDDILAAVLGAKLAGMKVAAVYDKYAEHQMEDIKKNADYFAYSFDDLLKLL